MPKNVSELISNVFCYRMNIKSVSSDKQLTGVRGRSRQPAAQGRTLAGRLSQMAGFSAEKGRQTSM